jgi:hypothetical protein
VIAALRRLPSLETALLLVATLALIALAALNDRAKQSGVAFDSYSSYDAQSGGLRACTSSCSARACESSASSSGRRFSTQRSTR